MRRSALRRAAVPRPAAWSRRGFPGLVALLIGLAPRTVPAAFERPPLDAEAEAMGGVLAVSPDEVFGNPAGGVLVDPAPLRLRAAAARPFGLAGLRESQVSGSRTGTRFALGIGARSFGSPDYEERELRLTAAWAAAPSVRLGAAGRGLSAGGSFAPVRSFAVDLAFRARAEPATEIAALVEAVLGEVPGDPRGELRRTAFGIARGLGPTVVVRVELQRQGRDDLAAALGVSWAPVPFLILRAGAREDPRTVSWGFTARRGSLSVSGAASEADPLGRTLRFGLEIAPGGLDPPAGIARERLKCGPSGTD